MSLKTLILLLHYWCVCLNPTQSKTNENLLVYLIPGCILADERSDAGSALARIEKCIGRLFWLSEFSEITS